MTGEALARSARDDDMGQRGSVAHRLEHDPLRTLPVPLAVEHALPGAEIESSGGDRHDHLVPDRERAEMRRRVVLTRAAVVAIGAGVPRRDTLLEPVEDVG